MMVKHYIEFIYPGVFFSESNIKEINKRNPKSVEIPNAAFGFRFMDREEMELKSGEILKGDFKNISGWYYEGKKMTLKDVKMEMPAKNILIDNMLLNKWKSIVWTKFNQAIPLYENDVVIAS